MVPVRGEGAGGEHSVRFAVLWALAPPQADRSYSTLGMATTSSAPGPSRGSLGTGTPSPLTPFPRSLAAVGAGRSPHGCCHLRMIGLSLSRWTTTYLLADPVWLFDGSTPYVGTLGGITGLAGLQGVRGPYTLSTSSWYRASAAIELWALFLVFVGVCVDRVGFHALSPPPSAAEPRRCQVHRVCH